jgi:hypothetical protein
MATFLEISALSKSFAPRNGGGLAVVNRAIRTLTTREMSAQVLNESWRRLSFSDELLQDAFGKLAKDAEALGYLPTSDVSGIFEPGLSGSQ